ncbi:hypothetical protein GCM10010398_69570 [Streptomyces fimbriatus]
MLQRGVIVSYETVRRWETLSTGKKAVNRSRAKIPALVEQAVAVLKS